MLYFVFVDLMCLDLRMFAVDVSVQVWHNTVLKNAEGLDNGALPTHEVLSWTSGGG